MGTGLHKGVWANIQSGNNDIDKVGVHFSTSFYQKIGNGNTVRFWEDVWNTHGLPLKHVFPRLYALEIDKECLVSDRWKLVNTVWSGNWNWRCEPRGRVIDELAGLQHVLNSLSLTTCDIDKWQWSLATNGKFTVHKLASLIYRNILGPFSIGCNHIWNNWTPIKVNICIWRAANNRLPTLSALNSKGIIPASLLCPLCDEATETIDHVLYECILARRIWLKCWRWWGIVVPTYFSIKDTIFRSLAQTDSKLVSKALQGVFYVLMWSIWKWRNRVVHASNNEKDAILIEDIFSQIQQLSLLWISNRCKKFNLDWGRWILAPKEVFR
ncbi:RNA-directed DNA polymerase, eukaryota, Reverse transcriptase zinc-binding domain protein [Artemisia annua]|uniref:RNA-directed DNA polymerase, eukaryota, Reverse transcriptase zinc-binding domain protein n=1 Tax=Artemisia annua TaxID=35608 RepID=A0A2U1M714_ARTAN|nr:RNA-directed DNA polymerase, eukaryota, Reverse transcriptase zinc-binding domain protein [Artemisia annua]